MKNCLARLKNACLLLLLISCLFSCSSVPEKAKPKTHTVEILQMQFQPAELMVQKGDSVMFINEDLVVHDVTEEKTKAWTSSALPPDKTYTMVVNESANYYCTLHPVMKGKLVVK
jgi:plastocyanin